jgi:hypothetical protein
MPVRDAATRRVTPQRAAHAKMLPPPVIFPPRDADVSRRAACHQPPAASPPRSVRNGDARRAMRAAARAGAVAGRYARRACSSARRQRRVSYTLPLQQRGRGVVLPARRRR